jgi:hypothetical protein
VSSQQKEELDALIRKLPLDFGADLAEHLDPRIVELDVVVQNAGHLYVGYLEAFTAEHS